jgi:hypothetical protein
MNLPAKWRSVFWSRKLQAAPGRDARLEAATASGLDDLQKRLNHWTDLWTAETDPAVRTAAQQVVAERLSRWMERCFGQHVTGSLSGNDSQISLASSTPIFTAFLGRRATRELSRRVLQDI